MTAAHDITDPELGTITCRVTGAEADPRDVDALAEFVAQLDEDMGAMRATRALAVQALVALTDEAGDMRKTRHLVGAEHTVRLTMPSGVDYDRGLLRHAWQSAPKVWRDRLLRVGSVEVQAREWKKWRDAASSDPEFVAVRNAIKAAERETTRGPSVRVERRDTK